MSGLASSWGSAAEVNWMNCKTLDFFLAVHCAGKCWVILDATSIVGDRSEACSGNCKTLDLLLVLNCGGKCWLILDATAGDRSSEVCSVG